MSGARTKYGGAASQPINAPLLVSPLWGESPSPHGSAIRHLSKAVLADVTN